jgi:hypothetical protein
MKVSSERHEKEAKRTDLAQTISIDCRRGQRRRILPDLTECRRRSERRLGGEGGGALSGSLALASRLVRSRLAAASLSPHACRTAREGSRFNRRPSLGHSLRLPAIPN